MPLFLPTSTPHRRGITILEVITSLVLLVGVGTMVLSALGYVERAAARDRIRLAGYEAVHRIILQFIDDPQSIRTSLDSRRRSIHPAFVNGYEFGFQLDEELLVSETSETGGVVGVARADYDLEELLSSKLKLIRVRVWLTEGKAGYAPEQTVASINRIYNIMNNTEQLLDELRAATAERRDNR